ncbi:MAG: NnrS family protein, partial [Polaromonas sp.]|nr:NnrS family protein [Polaromonas sp.]
QSLKNRLLAMLHIGFVWLGLALALSGITQWLGWMQGTSVLPLGSLHALTMGCLASLMLAMVTRVSCGHSGRALVADKLAWSLFWLLQAATLLRIVAAAPFAFAAWLLLAVALLWAGVMAVWGVRLGNWYGRLRADGRPG